MLGSVYKFDTIYQIVFMYIGRTRIKIGELHTTERLFVMIEHLYKRKRNISY